MFTSPHDANIASTLATNSSSSSSSPVDRLVHSILSADSNVMLAAIISLLVVILFVLLLHIYAKWFLFRARRQRSRSSAFVVPQLLAPGTTIPTTGTSSTALHHFHSFAIDATYATSPTKGLESAAISSIPIFVFKSKTTSTDDDDDDVDVDVDVDDQQKQQQHELIECAICLSVFEDEDIGRRLPGCSHAFHVDCVDMWFASHSTCPICRSCPILTNRNTTEEVEEELLERELSETDQLTGAGHETSRILMEIIVEVPNLENNNENVGSPEEDAAEVDSSPSSPRHAPPCVGDAMKRMMSRNRSERKVHPSDSDEGLVESNV